MSARISRCYLTSGRAWTGRSVLLVSIGNQRPNVLSHDARSRRWPVLQQDRKEVRRRGKSRLPASGSLRKGADWSVCAIESGSPSMQSEKSLVNDEWLTDANKSAINAVPGHSGYEPIFGS